MSSDVPAALALLLQTAAASIPALALASPQDPPPPLPALRKDFLALITLIYAHTTKLSIALNPASPAPSAALSPAKELTALAGTLASNVASFDPQVHGAAIADEVRALAKDILCALRDLASVHLSLHTAAAAPLPPRVKDGAGEEYLVRTGAVHDLITRAQKGLSDSNLTAVKKKWKEHGDTIADALLELDEDATDEEEDEGWDDPELDFGFHAKKKTPEQLKLAVSLRDFLKRVSTLYALIPTLLLRPPSTASNPALEALLVSAPPLATAVDELVSRVYDPEDLAGVRDEFVSALQKLGDAVDAIFAEMKDVPSESETKPVKKGGREWFAVQFGALRENAAQVGNLEESNTS
ncbi:hypothetical protein FA95DRAFT_1480040 [Auriscalpium vulgare]|uniref:Uncharacterized protein n=1 Tax=Auriscalpium vulgare TaxID=40419 RepID=A0ACB8SCU3_9AGAM|nr:hypothetical protein FA95DRAFT_1480040 [Auriscalpium vulgare]